MNKITKNLKKILSLTDKKKIYNIESAIKLLKKIKFAKFDESINVTINIKKRSKINLAFRKTIFLPHSTGKKNKLLILIEKKFREEIKNLGIKYVGGKDLIRTLNKEYLLKFNYIITSKKYMDNLLEFADILGKKNLIPNYDNYTIINDLNYLEIIDNFNKSKNLSIYPDKYGIIHLMIGKISNSTKKLIENYNHIVNIIKKINIGNLPLIIKSIYINNTMSPSLKLYSYENK